MQECELVPDAFTVGRHDRQLHVAPLDAGAVFRRDGVEGFVPGDAGEAAFALGAGTLHGVEEAIGVVFALKVLGDLGAEEAASDRVIRVTAHAFAFAVFDGDEDGAGIRAIESADGVFGFLHGRELLLQRL